MKKIVCELCEGMDFAKADGMFTCQGCGTKYTLEQAKAMMVEVEGDVSPMPSVGGVPVSNVNQQQLDNLLMLATNAYSASNNEETEKYCNRAIELDATCYKAWILKAKAIGWSSKINDNRLEESAHSFMQAINFAPEEEKGSVREEAIDELKRLGLAVASVRQKRFADYPDDEELNGFISDLRPLINAMIVVSDKPMSAEKMEAISKIEALTAMLGKNPKTEFLTLKVKALAADIPEEFFGQIALKMNGAAVAGFKTARDKFNNDRRPDRNDFNKALTSADNCITLIECAIDASDDDDDEDITRYENIKVIHEFTIDLKAYANYGDTYRNWMLTDKSKEFRRKKIKECDEKIKEIKKKAEEAKKEAEKAAAEAKQARIDAYWAEHAEEKETLEKEKADLVMKKESLSKEIGELNKQIKKIENEANVSTPSEDEKKKIQSQISELRTRKAGLGLFAGKEKKQIDEEISVLEGRMPTLEKKIQEEKSDITKSILSRKQPLVDQGKELGDEVAKVNKRITEIDNRFKEDPEE